MEVPGNYTKEANEAWKELVGKYLIENARVEPLITMTFDENWMIFTIRYVVEYKTRRSTKDLLFTRILEGINNSADKLSIASAAAEITLMGKPQLQVKMDS